MTNEERISDLIKANFSERQAFPSTYPASTLALAKGLSRRELFAAMAMNALDIGSQPPAEAARFCVEYADALCRELDKPELNIREFCLHGEWTDLENGIGQCRNCMSMLPYSAFKCPPDQKPFGCAPDEA